MALDVNCSVPGCGLPMTMPGATLFSPPIADSVNSNQVMEYRICALCWAQTFRKLLNVEKTNIAEPVVVPLTADEKLMMLGPGPKASMSITFEKDPTVAGIDPEFDAPKILGRALRTKVEEDLAKYLGGVSNPLWERAPLNQSDVPTTQKG